MLILYLYHFIYDGRETGKINKLLNNILYIQWTQDPKPGSIILRHIHVNDLLKYFLTKCFCYLISQVTFFFKILSIHERHTKKGRDIGRGRSRLPPGSLVWNSILGLRDHDLSQRQMLNHWAFQVLLTDHFCISELTYVYLEGFL